MKSFTELLTRLRHNQAAMLALCLAGVVLLFLSRILLPPAGQLIGGYDTRSLFYPWFTFARQALQQGDLPLWDASHFAGYPFLSNPQVALFYPPTWLALLLPPALGLSWYVALHLWLSGLGMLLFVRHQGGSWSGAALAALAFTFSGYTAARLWAGHVGLLATNSWLPWLLLATTWSVRRGDGRSAIIAGVPLGLALLAGHTTSLLYLGLVWLLFACYLVLSRQRWQLVGRQLLLATLVGVGLSAIQLLPLVQFSRVASRTAESTLAFATAYSLPPAHLITLLIPDYFGEPSRAGYWSVPTFEELTYYVGVLPLLGLLLALRRPTRLTWFYLGLIIIGLLLALGSYGFLYPLAYTLVPPFRLARAPGRAAFLFVFAASALLGETVSAWERRPVEARTAVARWLSHWALPAAAVTLLTALAATGAVFSAQHPTETSGRLWLQVGGWGWALLLLLVGGGLLWRYLRQPGAITGLALALLLLVDLWLFGFKLVRLEPAAVHPLWRDAKAIIGATDERVLPWGIPIFEQNGAGPVGLRTVFGYNALEVGTNTAFTGSIPDPRATTYDILGVGYVLATGPLAQYGDGERPLTLVDHSETVWVYRRARVLPLARLVYQVEVIDDPQQAIAHIHQPDFDPTATAVLATPPPCALAQPAVPGTAVIRESGDGYWRVQTDSPTPALLLLAETAYPGWRVTIDGQPATWLTAYTTLRAVCVPAGTHTVEWTFAPTVYLWGGLITLLALLVVATAVWPRRPH